MKDNSAMPPGLEEDFKYVLTESGFDDEYHPRSYGRLFLCETLHERELLAGLLCQHVRSRYPEVPVVPFRVSGSHTSDEVARTVAVALETAAKKRLSKSPFDGLSLNSLTTFDLRVLIDETINELTEAVRWNERPLGVIVVADITRTNPTLSTLNYLRSMISKGARVTWIVFAPEMILDVTDPSGTSPFYNIFAIRDLKTKFISTPSPYIPGPPIRRGSMMFFGRDQILADIQRSIMEGSRPVALWGPRRIGKTSVLLNLLEPLRDYRFPVYIDLQAFFSVEDVGLFYSGLAQEVLFCLEEEEPDKGESPPPLDRSISLDEVMGIVSRVERRTHRKVVFLFDEIEGLEHHVKDGLTVLGQLTDAGLVGLIVGAVRVKQWLSDSTLPIFGKFAGRKLGCLERDAAIELITRPVENVVSYEAESIDEIIQLVGTHPQYLQTLCDLVLAILNREASTIVTTSTVRRAYGEFTKRRAHTRYLLHMLEPLCLDLLDALAEVQSRTKQTGASIEQLSQYVTETEITPAGAVGFDCQLEQAIEALCDQEIIESHGNRYHPKAQVYLDTLVRSED